MTRGEMVAAEAREWVGTRFVWGQSQKQVGCDCKGLVQGVARHLGFPEAETFYATFASYRPDKAVPSALLVEGMAAVFDRADAPQVGDVLLLKVGGKPTHLAICTGDRAIHAKATGDKEWVADNRLDALLKMAPLHSVWRWRDGD